MSALTCTVAAVSDVHSPRYLPEFSRALNELAEKPGIFVMAGDMIDKGRILFLEPILSRIKRALGDLPLVAVFGNEEYQDIRGMLRSRYSDITWLEDEATYIDCNGVRVAIVGTMGSLQRPTRWQARNLPGIAETYKRRPRLILSLIREAKKRADKTVLVSHYALSRATIEGEPVTNWPWLYSPRMETVIKEAKPDIAIHGHAHKGKPFSVLDGVPIYNVAFPLNKKIIIINI